MITRLPRTVPLARRVQDALAGLIDAIDAAKAGGATIPPVCALGVTNVGVGLLTIAASEAHANGHPSPFANLHGPAILATITPPADEIASPLPAAFGGAHPTN